MRSGLVLLACAVIGPFAASAARSGVPAAPGADVACLSWQTGAMQSSYRDALDRCRAPAEPDLTGNEELQREARVAGTAFRVRPAAEAALKRTAAASAGPAARPGIFHVVS